MKQQMMCYETQFGFTILDIRIETLNAVMTDHCLFGCFIYKLSKAIMFQLWICVVKLGAPLRNFS